MQARPPTECLPRSERLLSHPLDVSSFLTISCKLFKTLASNYFCYVRSRYSRTITLLERLHVLGNVQNCGRKQHNKNAWEYEQYKREEYFDLCLRAHLLGPLPSFLTDLVAKPAQRSDNRSSEPVSLRQHAHKQRELWNFCTLCRALPCLQPRLAGKLLKIDLHELLVNIRVADDHLLSHAQHGLIQTQPRLHADNQQVERVGKASPDSFSSFLDLHLQPHVRDQIEDSSQRQSPENGVGVNQASANQA